MTTTKININGEVREARSLTGTQDRTFREAWQFNGKAVEVDMAKAVEIQKDVLRADRAVAMADLDVDMMKALGTGKPVAVIEANKQVLRDITDDARLAAAATPDELKALTLEALTA